jgi:nucleotidyltransferase substrate binding protein (TIGR01987 family)
MKEVLSDKLENFSNALRRLEEVLKEDSSGIALDATIKRFEFTYEMSWKALKKFMAFEGFDCASARECFKKAYQTGYINNEQAWLSVLEDRNTITHIYNENEAKLIYAKIKETYAPKFAKLEQRLKNKLVGIK